VTVVTTRRDELKIVYDQLVTEIQKIVHDNKAAKENVDKYQKLAIFHLLISLSKTV
jgi:hypothetical protein